MVIGAGPIVIGQACEFDYSGTQACKALREEGYRVVLVNSNPATIMTDSSVADATYIEPIHPAVLEQIILKEKPDAILPTMGGQTALNAALQLHQNGVLQRYGVELIGASVEAIEKAENRDLFIKAMNSIGMDSPQSGIAHNLEEAYGVLEQVGFPCIIRPSYTLGGSGGGIAYDREEFEQICNRGFDLSPANELLIDESLIGWKEFEMEVVRDCKDNCIIVCSIENLDPMGVHTGDSITVAPALTLTDKEYQILRNASIAILREIGVDTGGSNVQFAIHPQTGKLVVIEMNPRVSRSSALASKATGFPIARVAAKLSVGYTLDELDNEITGGKTPSSFEPSIDYIVTKIPRFAFEKFPQADARLSTQMKSVGEVMAIGSTFAESLQKALRGLEVGIDGLEHPVGTSLDVDIERELSQPGALRLLHLADAMRDGISLSKVQELTGIDPWFLYQIEHLIKMEQHLSGAGLQDQDAESLTEYKKHGFSDARLASLLSCNEAEVRTQRQQLGVYPVFKRIDSCAAEFATPTAYMYSTYADECEANPDERPSIVVLGGGPNRIGQGIEFDYCCVHAVQVLREKGFNTIMVNCNPETVSTDYDTADRLYFEPITLEDVLEICRVEQPQGVIVQFGGQTPLNLAKRLESEGVPIIGTSADAIDTAEDRERFQQLMHKLGLLQPENAIVKNSEEALQAAEQLGYPLMVRPSYVLGGRAMEIVGDKDDLQRYIKEAFRVSQNSPILLDRYLQVAVEVDVDVVCDGEQAVIGGVMQHVEEAGVHSGDSACSLPAYSLPDEVLDNIREQALILAKEIGVVGLMNMQCAYAEGKVYILEVNARASRTVPFVSKCIGVSLAQVATRLMVGDSLQDVGFTNEVKPRRYFVKEAVFPFVKFPGVDPILGPEMRSTGEVMGVGDTFAEAFKKSQQGCGIELPSGGTLFISVRDRDKGEVAAVAERFIGLGFELLATHGTAEVLRKHGLQVETINKVYEGQPHIVDAIHAGRVHLIINTTLGYQQIMDSATIRSEAILQGVPCYTTLAAGMAVADALGNKETRVCKLQDYALEK